MWPQKCITNSHFNTRMEIQIYNDVLLSDLETEVEKAGASGAAAQVNGEGSEEVMVKKRWQQKRKKR